MRVSPIAEPIAPDASSVFTSYIDVRFRPWALIGAHPVWSQSGPRGSGHGEQRRSVGPSVTVDSSARWSARIDADGVGGAHRSRSPTHRLRMVIFQAVCRLERVLSDWF